MIKIGFQLVTVMADNMLLNIAAKSAVGEMRASQGKVVGRQASGPY